MLSVKEAETIICDLLQPLDSKQDRETVNLWAVDHRILVDSVSSSLDFPHWDNSAMDGYAVCYSDVQQASEENPTVLTIVEEIPAGSQPQVRIRPGEAARIFTGAVIPLGADTVVMQEKTRREENRVFILAAPQPREFIRYQAAFYRAGEQLLPAGIRLQAPEIAILAAAQCHQVNVFRRPKVAIFSCGDELVTPDQPLKFGQIVDSNLYALAALVKELGAEPLILGIVKDEPRALQETIAQAINQSDLILSTGGVSVGDYDYIHQVLASLNAQIHFRSVKMRPGKPLTFATFPNKQVAYFGLPGNPVSALVTFWRFVKPAIAKISGLRSGWEAQFIQVRSAGELKSSGNLETYIWGKLQLNNGIYEFHPAFGQHSSGNLINLSQTNALAVLPIGQTFIAPQENVLVLMIGFFVN